MIFIGNRYEITDRPVYIEENKLYNAYDSEKKIDVKIKIIENNRYISLDFIPNLIDESIIIDDLRSPYILKILDVGVHRTVDNLLYYIVYENFRGVSLATLNKGAYLHMDALIRIATQTVKALQAYYNLGKKHGSLRPDNILVNERYEIKIADFGITEANKGTNIRCSGNLKYLSPSQLSIDFTDIKSDLYCLGVILYESVFKTFPFNDAHTEKQLIKAIDKGVITPSSTYNNTDCIKVADRTMCNVLRGLDGTMTIQGAFNNSLNVGTITAIRKLGNGSQINLPARQTLYEYYHDKFGFGAKTGIELGEASGYIYPPDSAEGNEVRYSAMTYGQSMNLTMVQVAAGFSSLVNGGQYYKPTILVGTIDESGNLKSSENKVIRQTVSGGTSSQMRTMLTTARRSSFLSKSDKSGYEIGGKTGTSEAVVNGAYTQKETIATYIGYGGGKNGAEYVIMVRVAAPGKGINLQGNLHAGPIFTDISNWMIDYMKIAPKE